MARTMKGGDKRLTTYTEPELDDLCMEASRHGIKPPRGDNYIRDTMFDMIKAICKTMDRVRALEEGK